jgi:hypothetical protein
MDKREEERPPFNERAALDELERFKNDIERYRQQRKAAGEEFDQFVQSFKAPQPPSAATPARPAASRPPEQPRQAPRVDTPRVEPPLHASAQTPPQVQPAAHSRPLEPIPPVAPLSSPPLPPVRPETSHIERGRIDDQRPVAKPVASERMSAERAHGKTGGPNTIVVLALLLIAAGIAAWYFWPLQTDTATTAPGAATTTPVPQAPAAAPAEPAPAPAAAAPSNETVLTTLAPVWLRVIADGVKIREDEFPTGTRIPIDVKKTLVIRTGNAGAVSLTLNGKDQGPLGAEGQVVTRTFTIPER